VILSLFLCLFFSKLSFCSSCYKKKKKKRMMSRWARRLVRATKDYLDAGENSFLLAICSLQRNKGRARRERAEGMTMRISFSSRCFARFQLSTSTPPQKKLNTQSATRTRPPTASSPPSPYPETSPGGRSSVTRRTEVPPRPLCPLRDSSRGRRSFAARSPAPVPREGRDRGLRG